MIKKVNKEGPWMVKTIPKKRFLSVLIKLKRNDMYTKGKRFWFESSGCRRMQSRAGHVTQ